MPDARDTAVPGEPLAAQTENEAAPLLAMQGIVKRFGANLALNGVDFTAIAGEIHALLGENGAGKSTLMHVLSGLTQPNRGAIRLDGKSVRVASPRAARALGIAMVHQHFTLVPAFTVAENLALDAETGIRHQASGIREEGDSKSIPTPDPRYPTPPSRRSYSVLEAAAPALERARSLGWQLDPHSRAADLSVGAQQRIEITKALATDARLLIFDEPTASLSRSEVEELFQVFRRLRAEGRAVILIAHKLAEILAVADRVTVLRRGSRVASCPVAATNAAQLAVWMIGTVETPETNAPRPEPPDRPAATAFPDAPACVAANLTVRGDRGEAVLRGVSLTVRQGEILGIGGVDGNGQAELAEALVGLRPLASGALAWQGQPFRAGVAPTVGYIPQDRRRAGLAVTMTIAENLLLEAVRDPAYRLGPFLRRKALRRLAQDLIRTFDIRAPGATLPASSLSGGNQQKIVVARALHAQPDFIVAVNPTRGLDIGATRFVHERLRQARARGAAVVLISADLEELAALADRAAILSGGSLTETALDRADSAEIGLLLGGVTGQNSPSRRAGDGPQAGAEETP